MSLVRLLMYSNELDIEALIPTTSTWQKAAAHPETMHALIKVYGEVRPNLLLHASGWPEAGYLDQRIAPGQPAYGRAATGPGKSSTGSKGIIAAVDKDDPRPLWICLWGGANTLAQALIDVRATGSAADVDKFVSKLRISSISDQDDAGPWIRREFPNLFYIVQPSSPDGGQYYYATWTGISGDAYYRNGAGADFTTVTNEWLETNIRSKGPLGKLYPRFMFIMEGDTPSYLGLIDNGLSSWSRPDWGGWGGRYIYRQPYGETHPIWTQGGDEFMRVTSQDTVTGVDGAQHISDQATIWRWREAFFQKTTSAARMELDYPGLRPTPATTWQSSSWSTHREKPSPGPRPSISTPRSAKRLRSTPPGAAIPMPVKNCITTGSTTSRPAAPEPTSRRSRLPEPTPPGPPSPQPQSAASLGCQASSNAQATEPRISFSPLPTTAQRG